MFRNKPSSSNKEKLQIVKKRKNSTKKMNTDGGIFNIEKGQKIRDISSSASSRTETRHEKQPHRMYSAGDNGSSMLEAYKEEKVSWIGFARGVVATDCIFVYGFDLPERWKQG